MKWLKAIVLGLMVLGFVASLGTAQTVTGVSDLEFGNMFPGVPQVVTNKSSSAAEFTVTGTAGAEVTLDFLLPEYVSISGGNMPLLFSTTDCSLDSSLVPDQSSPSADNLNPYETITYRLGSNGLTVWLGGRCVPGLVQKAGDYSATIRLTVTYTGN